MQTILWFQTDISIHCGPKTSLGSSNVPSFQLFCSYFKETKMGDDKSHIDRYFFTQALSDRCKWDQFEYNLNRCSDTMTVHRMQTQNHHRKLNIKLGILRERIKCKIEIILCVYDYAMQVSFTKLMSIVLVLPESSVVWNLITFAFHHQIHLHRHNLVTVSPFCKEFVLGIFLSSIRAPIFRHI